MAKDWRDEVRDILEREAFELSGNTEAVEQQRPRRWRPKNLWLVALGDWGRRRFATTNEMLVTAASLVVLALLLYATPMRQLAAVLAVTGGLTFLLAIPRGIIERRRMMNSGGLQGPRVWRGQIIDLEEHRARTRFSERVRAWWRRRR